MLFDFKMFKTNNFLCVCVLRETGLEFFYHFQFLRLEVSAQLLSSVTPLGISDARLH